MSSIHRAILAVALAFAVAAGAAAATQTVSLGAHAQKAPPPSPSALAAQKAKLAAAEGSIHRALTATPPRLPAVPKFAPLGEPTLPPLVVTRVVPIASSASAPRAQTTAAGRSARAATTVLVTPRAPVNGAGENHARVREGDSEHGAPGGAAHPEPHDD